MTLCAICNMHMETRSAGFLIEPQNQGRRFFCLDIKTVSSDLMI
jgi:hypothetical protein